MNKPSFFTQVMLLVLVIRLSLVLIASSADLLIPYEPSFPYSQELLASSDWPRWLYSFANFDGVHYITIALQGYLQTGYIQAFFPLFPLLLGVVFASPRAIILGGQIINLLLVPIVCVLLNKIAIADSMKLNKALLLLIFLLFPTGFFLFGLYGESLFLALLLGSLYSARKGNWLLSVLLASFATATRVVGIFLLPALAVELYQQWSEQRKKIPGHTGLFSTSIQFLSSRLLTLGLISLGSLGLLSYMVYLQVHFNDALYFFHVQSEFGAGRQETIILLPQVFWRSIKMLATVRPFDWKYFSIAQDLLFTVGAGWLLAKAKTLSIRSSYLVFSISALILPTLTGSLSSMPRYVLVCFPIFYVLAIQLTSANKLTRITILTISGMLLIINTILFVQGYWVA